MRHRMLASVFLVLLSASISFSALADNQCEFKPWSNYQSSSLWQHKNMSAYVFASKHLNVDADGAPNAYHPKDIGIDYLANAGYPNSSWWSSVLVADPRDATRAYVQGEGAFAGYFISKTSLQDKSKASTDPSRYVDATKIPYLVFPGKFLRKKGSGRLGDIGVALNLSNGKSSPFVVADIGPSSASLGEISIALAENLGGQRVNPKNGAGAPHGRILYVVFPHSSKQYPWPLKLEDLQKHAQQLLAQAGGMDAAKTCAQGL